eukprot:6175916-Pleurochrysis_carterae.AAC.1
MSHLRSAIPTWAYLLSEGSMNSRLAAGTQQASCKLAWWLTGEAEARRRVKNTEVQEARMYAKQAE